MDCGSPRFWSARSLCWCSCAFHVAGEWCGLAACDWRLAVWCSVRRCRRRLTDGRRLACRCFLRAVWHRGWARASCLPIGEGSSRATMQGRSCSLWPCRWRGRPSLPWRWRQCRASRPTGRWRWRLFSWRSISRGQPIWESMRMARLGRWGFAGFRRIVRRSPTSGCGRHRQFLLP